MAAADQREGAAEAIEASLNWRDVFVVASDTQNNTALHVAMNRVVVQRQGGDVGWQAESATTLEFVDNPALNTDTLQGSFMLTIFAAVAELERATIRERQAWGVAIAKAAGKTPSEAPPHEDCF